MPNERKISKVQAKLQATHDNLKQAEIDKGGLTLTDVVSVVSKQLGWWSIWNSGNNDVWRVALRREGWERRRMSRRWFYAENR